MLLIVCVSVSLPPFLSLSKPKARSNDHGPLLWQNREMRNPHLLAQHHRATSSYLGRRFAQYTWSRSLSGASQPCFRFSGDMK